jgi:hypothetical protein
MTSRCTCGHDYGEHDASRRGSPCSGEACTCRKFTWVRVGRFSNPTLMPLESLPSKLNQLNRIAVALERIATALERRGGGG